MRRTAELFAWVAVLVLVTGCARRPTQPREHAEASWYRTPDLFSAFDPAVRDVSLSNAYLLELACFVGDKGTFELDKTLAAWGFTRRRDFRDIQTRIYGYAASNGRMIGSRSAGPTFRFTRPATRRFPVSPASRGIGSSPADLI